MAPTSTNAPNPTDANRMSSITEAQYLDQQAAEARRAISRVIDDLQHELAEGADPRQWAKAYPWWTMAGSVALGFIAATGLVPSREDQALKRLAKLEKALHVPAESEDRAEDSKKRRERSRGGLMALLGRELISAVRPALLGMLSASVSGKMAQDDLDTHQEGAEAPASAMEDPGRDI